jgi:hypothetical protein
MSAIYGSLADGAVTLISSDNFIAFRYSTDEVKLNDILTNPVQFFPVFNGHEWVITIPLTNRGCGSDQVDGWQHGGWYGEAWAKSFACETPPIIPPIIPPIPPILEPVCLTCNPDIPVPPTTTVPEGSTVLMCAVGLAVIYLRLRMYV